MVTMPNKMKMVRLFLTHSFWTVFGAFGFGSLSFWVVWIRLADENMLVAYIMNGIIILLLVVIDDKIRYYYMNRKPSFKKKSFLFFFDIFVVGKSDMGSWKTSLYLFYIFALVSSHILRLNPYINVSESIRNYFTTVGYGLIVLIAIDKFLNNFIEENKRIRDYYEKRHGIDE